MSSNADFVEKTSNFNAWLSNAGVQVSPSLSIADLRSIGKGRGVVATQNIISGETLFTIHNRRTLIGGDAAAAAASTADRADQEDDPWTTLLLQLLVESGKHATRESLWNEYLDILPSSTAHFDTLMFWTDHELAELQASFVVHKIGKTSAEASFRRLLPRITSQPAHYGFAHEASQSAEALEIAVIERAHVMASLIMAYAFDVEPYPRRHEPDDDGYVTDEEEAELPKAMVPLADLLNADGDRNNARLFYEDDGSLVMRAVADIACGEEIFNDYGPLPRSELLRRYGYVTDNYAQYDVVDVPLSLFLTVAGSMFGLQQDQLCVQLGNLLDCDVDHLPDSFELAKADLADLRRNGLSAWTELFPVLPAILSSQTDAESQASAYLAELLRQRLGQYGTSLLQDQVTLKSWQETQRSTDSSRSRRRLHMALQVRIGEKQILEDALSLLDTEQPENTHRRKKQKR